jgi:hypothetical protein
MPAIGFVKSVAFGCSGNRLLPPPDGESGRSYCQCAECSGFGTAHGQNCIRLLDIESSVPFVCPATIALPEIVSYA